MKNFVLTMLVLAIMTAIVLFSGFGVTTATLGKIGFYGLLIALLIKAIPPMQEKRH